METSPEQTPDYLMIDGNGLVKDLNSRLGIPANAQLFNKLFFNLLPSTTIWRSNQVLVAFSESMNFKVELQSERPN